MTQRLLLTLSEGIDRIGTRVASAAPAASFKSVNRRCGPPYLLGDCVWVTAHCHVGMSWLRHICERVRAGIRNAKAKGRRLRVEVFAPRLLHLQ